MTPSSPSASVPWDKWKTIGDEICETNKHRWSASLSARCSVFNDYSSSCYRCWSICRYCGGWHLSFPYVALGIALIVWPHRLWLSHVAGGLLIGLALLRLLTMCKFRPHGKDDELLNHFDEHVDKYDNLSDVLVDNSMPEPGQSLEDEQDEDDEVAIHGGDI
ncbi:AGAP006999-PA-like protein [Anopheles sinensis]|uniref:AGAP006999-PA-like protein n=1 Tax=Anopheles sinensis TaxID=74873 RepID=A0A084WRQ5_ANOSI|nr:AGAP006999-PA-like protein [Anopheles sinensis]